MNQQQWQMKKDRATSISLPAIRAPGGLAVRGSGGDSPEAPQTGTANSSVDSDDCQTCFDWDAPAESSK